jgi:hypothetical protein
MACHTARCKTSYRAAFRMRGASFGRASCFSNPARTGGFFDKIVERKLNSKSGKYIEAIDALPTHETPFV